ncbi:PWWP domain-containing protein 2B-like isoform X1 [Acipenser oxyrinchus oxyrinchus]|uniref:PWWP domain-containing protein 2B-like isoform X1 n=1 Tax=Acipenser oxyrinchus oxyrinchus TaxID=40147 RepID=A0AAD8G469_ACIOX|nr:PWWP domain-containing protein 2B-like isoform X1 [Acipenser oxyrinchus oxyrinchus]
MEAAAEELRAGYRIPVYIDQIINDTLVVTLSHGDHIYTGILLNSSKKTGLFCLPDVLSNQDEPPVPSSSSNNNAVSHDNVCFQLPIKTEPQPCNKHTPKPTENQPISMPVTLPGALSQYPPYFEGAPFPQPLWVRQTYNQWVPQPPPRIIKRTKRRNRDSGRMTVSTIRLRPRQVLCEKCKNTLNSDEDNKDGDNSKAAKKENTEVKESKKREEMDNDSKKCKKEKKEEDGFPVELVPHSPVIKISYSTPQGKGEVIKIPSRVHGSVKPFCPKQLMQNGGGLERDEECQENKCLPDKPATGQAASIPKLKLTRPLHFNADVPPPKIRLKPRSSGGDSVSIYQAEFVDDPQRQIKTRSRSVHAGLHSEDSTERSSLEMSSGSSGEEDGFNKEHDDVEQHGDLTLLLNFRKRKADSSSLSVCSNDSLDESKSSSSDGASPELCDFAPGEDLSVSSSSKDEQKTVPPLTVRLHTKIVTKCVTEEGRTVSVGDIVWGKIHGFPWWPARVLSISTSKKEDDNPLWQEAKVSWFGSPTTSLLSVSKLSPFLEFFRLRFNRKKKGMYRRAIAEAAKAAEHLTPEITSLLTHCETKPKTGAHLSS